MNRQYRVREHHGYFYVEVLCDVTESKGMLWWRKTSTKQVWKGATSTGRAPIICRSIRIVDYSMPPFKTLEAAKKQIITFNTPDKIHHV